MKIGLFSYSHNFGLVISGKVIYDIVLDALMELAFVGKREQVFVLNTLNFRIGCCKFGIWFVSLWCKEFPTIATT